MGWRRMPLENGENKTSAYNSVTFPPLSPSPLLPSFSPPYRSRGNSILPPFPELGAIKLRTSDEKPFRTLDKKQEEEGEGERRIARLRTCLGAFFPKQQLLLLTCYLCRCGSFFVAFFSGDYIFLPSQKYVQHTHSQRLHHFFSRLTCAIPVTDSGTP